MDEADEIDTFLRDVHGGRVKAQKEGIQGTWNRLVKKVGCLVGCVLAWLFGHSIDRFVD